MPDTYDFGVFHLDAEEHRLLRDGRPVALSPKAFDLLLDLVHHAGRLREKPQLMEALWPGTFVEEVNLAYTVSALRKALGDERADPKFIETVPTRGYRFVGEVRPAGNGTPLVHLLAPPPPIAPARVPRWSLASALLAAAGLGAVVTLWIVARGPGPDRAATVPTRTTMALPAPVQVGPPPGSTVVYEAPRVAISPDGARVAYIGRTAGTTMLFVRGAADATFTALTGTEGAVQPFFSPDGATLGYLTNTQVVKARFDGTRPQPVCDVREPVFATWQGGDIYVGADNGHRLFRVPAEGGTPVKLAEPADPWWLFSDVLPGGRWALVHSSVTQSGGSDIAAIDTGSGAMRYLLASSFAGHFAAGHLFFVRAGAAMAVPIDPATLTMTGTPVLVAPDVEVDSFLNGLQLAASRGVLVYAPGGDRAVARIARVDRHGNVTDLDLPSRRYASVRLDPQGERLALPVADVRGYVWIYDLSRGEGRRLATPEPATFPLWSPDGRQMAYTAFPDPAPDKAPWPYLDGWLTIRAVDGEAGPGRRTKAQEFGEAWSPDGRTIVTHMFRLIDVATGSVAEVTGRDAFRTNATFSPSGRYVAYASDESGRFEIWVRSYPDDRVVRQISTDGGLEPVWTRSGELFYRIGTTWFTTRVAESPGLTWSRPEVVFTGAFGRYWGHSYDVSPDGQHFYVLRSDARAEPSSLHVVTNWRAIEPAR